MNIDGVLQAVRFVREQANVPSIQYVQKLKETSARSLDENQFILLLKPECFSVQGDKDVNVLEIIKNTLSEKGVSIEALTVMNGKYVKLNAVAENQYRMLNMYARYGIEIFPNPEQLDPSFTYIGAYPFLETYPQYTPAALERMAHAKGCDKLGNGLYSIKVNVDGQIMSVLNPFHPFQVSHFQHDDAAIVAALCTTYLQYEVIASDLIGFFNPMEAKTGSIRKELYNNKMHLSRDFSTIYNAVHNSPGTLEAMFSSLRYFMKESNGMVTCGDTILGHHLLSKGFKEEDLLNLRFNPFVKARYGKGDMLFDILEGVSNQQAFDLICNLLNKESGINA